MTVFQRLVIQALFLLLGAARTSGNLHHEDFVKWCQDTEHEMERVGVPKLGGS